MLSVIRSRRRGFTLIELLVVVSIIALLLAILLPSLQSALRTAKVTKSLTNLADLGKATNVYKSGHGDLFPTRKQAGVASTVFGSFEASRKVLAEDKRPIEIYASPLDPNDGRLYLTVGGDTNPPTGSAATAQDQNGSIGIQDIYGTGVPASVRISYAISTAATLPSYDEAGDKASISATPEVYNNTRSNVGSSYKYPAKTVLFADGAWVNARGWDVGTTTANINTDNSSGLRLRQTFANFSAPDAPGDAAKVRLASGGYAKGRYTSVLGGLTGSALVAKIAEVGKSYARGPSGNGVTYIDGHVDIVSQARSLNVADDGSKSADLFYGPNEEPGDFSLGT